MGERIEIEIDSTRILLSRGLYVSEITGAKTRAILIEMLAAGLAPVPLERMALVSDCTTDRFIKNFWALAENLRRAGFACYCRQTGCGIRVADPLDTLDVLDRVGALAGFVPRAVDDDAADVEGRRQPEPWRMDPEHIDDLAEAYPDGPPPDVVETSVEKRFARFYPVAGHSYMGSHARMCAEA